MPYSNQVSPSQTLISVFVGQIGGVDTHVCDARELHTHLGVLRDFSSWLQDRIEKYEFQENQDFAVAPQNWGAKRGGHNRKDYNLGLDMAKELSMVENNEKGREARRYFIAKEAEALAAAGKSVKLPQSELPQLMSKDAMEAVIALMRGAEQSLRLSQSSVLQMYQKIECKIGLSGLLPSYAVDAPLGSPEGSSELTKSLSELLEQFKVGISTVSMNRLLIKNGMLEENERPSTTKGVKKFKTVIDLHFGKNLTNPNNPSETQPHWFISKFEELLRRVMPLTVLPLPSLSCTLN